MSITHERLYEVSSEQIMAMRGLIITCLMLITSPQFAEDAEQPREIELFIQGYGLPMDVWRTVTPPGLSEKSSAHCVVAAEWISDFERLGEEPESLSVLFNASLKLKPGTPVTHHSGGEFPIPVPGPDRKPVIHFRKYGDILQASFKPSGPTTLDLSLSLEHSTLDEKNAALLNGMRIPGLNSRRIVSTIETQLDETVLVQLPDGDGKVLIYLITPERVEQSDAE